MSREFDEALSKVSDYTIYKNKAGQFDVEVRDESFKLIAYVKQGSARTRIDLEPLGINYSDELNKFYSENSAKEMSRGELNDSLIEQHLISVAEAYQPKTGQPCSCRKGIERDNCPSCEGTGQKIDFKAIRDKNREPAKKEAHNEEWHLKSKKLDDLHQEIRRLLATGDAEDFKKAKALTLEAKHLKDELYSTKSLEKKEAEAFPSDTDSTKPDCLDKPCDSYKGLGNTRCNECGWNTTMHDTKVFNAHQKRYKQKKEPAKKEPEFKEAAGDAPSAEPRAESYLFTYSLEKMVTAFNEENQDWSGQETDFGRIDKGTLDAGSTEEAVQKIGDMFGLSGFEAYPDEPGIFETNQTENGEGLQDDNGKYLTDYTLFLKRYKQASKNEDEVKSCPKCGSDHIQKAEGYKLNKCLSCHWAFDNESAPEYVEPLNEKEAANGVPSAEPESYLFTYSLNKMISEFDEQNQDWGGKNTDFGIVDSGNIEATSAEEAIRELGEEYGLSNFESNPDEPGWYKTNVVEDAEGNPDENGKYLADYILFLKRYKQASKKEANEKQAGVSGLNEPCQLCGTYRLKETDQGDIACPYCEGVLFGLPEDELDKLMEDVSMEEWNEHNRKQNKPVIAVDINRMKKVKQAGVSGLNEPCQLCGSFRIKETPSGSLACPKCEDTEFNLPPEELEKLLEVVPYEEFQAHTKGKTNKILEDLGHI